MKRNYGIDLLRIISMFMIVVLHILGTGAILGNAKIFSINYELMWLLEIACYVAVNCYALISGYVMCFSKVKYHKIIDLWLQVVFYTVSITLLFMLFNPSVVGIKDLMKSFLPVATNQYWYFTAYTGMFFFIPVLNHLINTMEKKDIEKVLITCIMLFSVYSILTINIYDPFKIAHGYSMIWLGVMYLIGGYLRKYNIASQYKRNTLLITYGIFTVITWLSRLVNELITVKIFGESHLETLLICYNSPTVIIASICLFLYFVTYDSSNKKVLSLIKIFAPVSFGVYLIHTNPLVFRNIMGGMFAKFAEMSLISLLSNVIFFALFIFINCCFIDYIRLRLFRLFKVNKLSVIVAESIKNIMQRYIIKE